MKSLSFLNRRKAGWHTPAGIALLYAAVATLWIALSGYLLTHTVDNPLLQSHIELAKGLAFVAVTSGLLYLLLVHWRESHAMQPVAWQTEHNAQPRTIRLVLIFIALVMLVPLIDLAIYKLNVPEIETNTFNNLNSIARLKSEEIENWLDERHGDAQGVTGDAGFARDIGHFLLGQQHDAGLLTLIKARLAFLQTDSGFDSIMLLDTGGRLITSLGKDVEISRPIRDLLHDSLIRKQIERSDLYLDESGHIHMDWVVPLGASNRHGKRMLAVVVLRTIPDKFLYPLIQTWPTASHSGETLLVKREGESILHISPLRRHPDAALTLNMHDPLLPAAIAIRDNKPGKVAGEDYRHRRVLAVYRPVAGTDWHLITKIDRNEVMTPLWNMLYWISIISSIAVGLISVVLLLYHRQTQRSHQMALQARSAASLRENNELLRLFIEHAPAALAMFDRQMRYLAASHRWVTDYGLDDQPLLGKSHYEIFPEITERWKTLHARAMAGETLRSEEDHLERTDGGMLWIKWEIRPWHSNSGEIGGIVIFSEDLSEYKRISLALQQNQARLDTLVRTIPDLVWLKDTQGVYLKCNPMFERLYGAREADIIGKTDYDFVDGKLADFSRENDRNAVAAGKPSINEEWLTFAGNGYHGLFETIKTPMKDANGKLIGVLGISRDITKRKLAEESLLKLSQAVEQSPNSIVITDLDANIEFANAAFASESGYSPDEAIGKNPKLLHSGKTPKSTYDDLWAHLKRGETWKGEFINRRKDGSEYVESAIISPVFQPDGRMTHFLAVKENITERKAAEAKIRRLTQLYATLSQCNQAIVRSTSAEELFAQICHDAVRYGGMKMTWIGMVDKDGKQVRPIAAYGDITALLDGIHISVDGNEAAGRGPVGIAIRENRPYWCQDYEQDSNLDPWRDRGMQFGVKSLAALPLRLNGTPVGNINFYSATVNAFDEEACRLLTEMATDISFALDNFYREAERNKAEALLKKSEAMLREVGKIAMVGGWEFNPRTGEGTWTQEVALIHDLDPEAHTSRDIGLEFYQGESRQKIEAAIAAAIADGTPYDLELELVTAKGNHKWVRSIALVEKEGEEIIRLKGTFQDITKLKLAQQELKFKNTILLTQQETTLDAILVVDGKGYIISYNQQFVDLWPAAANLVGKGDDAPVLQSVVDQCADPKAFLDRVKYLYEHHEEKSSDEILLKNGRVLDRYSAPITGADGHYYGRIWYFRDVTESRKAVQELADSEQRFRGLVEQSLAGIYIIQDGKLVYTNPRAAEIVGHGSVDDLIGKDFMQFIADADRDKVAENMRKLLNKEVPKVALEFCVIHTEGHAITVGANASYASYHGQPAVIGLIQDISEKKRDEERILKYVDQLKSTFMSTVQLATSLSEMRDPYTAGHERRVSEIAVAIATELGMDEQHIEGIKVAGYLHDIGKISIPSEILVKPGRLNATEYALVQGHAQASYEVLKHVEFPWPVATIALQHHERMDGSGYPNGLKGDEMLLESRIMAIADVVEAMASHRPYRPGLGIDKALAELERGRGTVYDADVVDTCLRLFRIQGFVLPPY